MGPMRLSRRTVVRLVVALVLCVPALAHAARAPGQTPHGKTPTSADRTVAPEVLKERRTARFPLPAATGILTESYCDAEGGIYLVYTAERLVLGPGPILPPSFAGQPITKLSFDSQQASEFSPGRVDGYTFPLLMRFAVSREGKVYGLYRARPSSVGEEAGHGDQDLIVGFDDDGAVGSTVRLHSPPSGQLDPRSFAPFADGNFLVAGIVHPRLRPGKARVPLAPGPKVVQHAPPGFGRFAGIFDRYGRFVTEVKLPAGLDSRPALAGPAGPAATRGRKAVGAAHAEPWGKDVALSAAVPGPADTVYLLLHSSPPRLCIISSAGEVAHVVSLHLPQAEAMIGGMSPAGRSAVLLSFSDTALDAKGVARQTHIYALVDPDTGAIIGAYRLPKNARVMPLCAAGRNDFLFIGSTKDGKLKVVSYRAP